MESREWYLFNCFKMDLIFNYLKFIRVKYLIILLVFSLLISTKLFPQNNIEKVIAEIEQNNTTLASLRKSADAELIGNKTGIFIHNPEVEFNYFLGSPTEIGNRTDFSVLQSFDFPSAYIYRKQISAYKDIQAELDYKKHRISILAKARHICNDLIYYNALKTELLKRISYSSNIAEAYYKMYLSGEVNIIDNNKAQLNLLNLRKEAESIEIERNVLLSELKNLNGGKNIEFSDSLFHKQLIPPNFDEWYIQLENNNPVLQWLEQEIIISQKTEKLNSALSLPKFETGYMSEKVVGELYRGLTVGISIPVFENKNMVKYAKAKTFAVESLKNDVKLQYYNELSTLHSKAVSLQSSIDELRSSISLYDNSPLLLKALENGEISLTEYLYELSIYYESYYKLLGFERELNNTVAELNKYL